MSRIARGGMAEIFLARQRAEAGVERPLVIKRVLPQLGSDPQFVRMFLDEARLAARLSHPNIAHLYDFGRVGESYFIAMEYIDGVTAGQIIRKSRDTGVPVGHAVRIAADVAQALYYAHRLCDPNGQPLGIVHRDVSPQNVLLSFGGTVKLVDFGIAKAATQIEGTRAGIIKGKFSYMSPEQCSGEPLDQRSDIFALGIVLYELLTGAPLYHAGTDYKTMRAIVDGPAPNLRETRPGLPADLCDIVQKALAKEPRERFQTAGEIQMALEEFLSARGLVSNAITLALYLDELFPEPERRKLDPTPFGESLRREGSATPSEEEIPLESSALLSPEPSVPRRRQATPTPTPMPAGDVWVGRSGAPRRARAVALGAAAATVLVAATLSIALFGPGGRREPPAANTHRAPPGEVAAAAIAPPLVVAGGLEPLPVEAAAPAAPDPRAPSQPSARRRGTEGELLVNTRPWSQVFWHGRLLGTTPLSGVRVPAGPLRLTLVDRDGNTHHKTVNVPSGGEARVFFDLGAEP